MSTYLELCTSLIQSNYCSKWEYFISYSMFFTDVVQYDANIELPKYFYANGHKQEVSNDAEQTIVQLLHEVDLNSIYLTTCSFISFLII